jgi:hypothetical protein
LAPYLKDRDLAVHHRDRNLILFHKDAKEAVYLKDKTSVRRLRDKTSVVLSSSEDRNPALRHQSRVLLCLKDKKSTVSSHRDTNGTGATTVRHP